MQVSGGIRRDAELQALRKDVWFIAVLTLYCRVEIYDEQP
jgi:hypothetical protein